MDNIINSPFKFLDPYGREDYDIFFGRDAEITELYQHIHKNRLVLVYGTSGTGKTSIVQCGLMNRMDDTDWMPFFIRRGANINDSLHHILQQAVDPDAGKVTLVQAQGNSTRSPLTAGVMQEQIYAALRKINLRYLRPVYLIFDQFEELLIFGTREERDNFMDTIDTILGEQELQFCNLLFIMREEFFAGLNEFEKRLPDFCDRRLRIEPMTTAKVEDVIVESCEKFGITLADGRANAHQITQVLLEKNSISLPYLQIYLDQLWRTVFMNERTEMLTFNSDIIQRFGKLPEVLSRFVRERITVIQHKLDDEFPDIPFDFVANVLDCFVSTEGTKQPLAYMRINDSIWFTGMVPLYLQNRPAGLMISCLRELEQNKILRTDGLTYELAHDVLAGLIENSRTEEQKKVAFTDQQLRSRYKGYQLTGEYLTKKEIEAYEPHIASLNLSPDLQKYYTASIEKRSQEDLETLDREIKIEQLRQRQKRWKWGWIAGSILMVTTTGLYFYSQSLKREFNRNESLVYMGYKMKNIAPLDALNLFPTFRETVYGEDTAWVNQKLLELVQMQEIQSLFAISSDTLQTSILEPGHIDISPDGEYLVVDNTPPDAEKGAYTYKVIDNKGKFLREFPQVSYAYFTNCAHVLLLCCKTGATAPQRIEKRIQSHVSETPLASEILLYDCLKDSLQTVHLRGPRRYLHEASDVAANAFSEYDSYRLRFMDGGNLLIPYVELDANGNLQNRVQIQSPQGEILAYLPSQSTVTISRNGKRILTLYTVDGINHLSMYDERGQLLQEISNLTFGDFAEDGTLIWGSDSVIHVKEQVFRTKEYCTYAFAGSRKLIARIGYYDEELELIDMPTGRRKKFSEKLVATNFARGILISQKKDTYRDKVKDTIWRRDMEGNMTTKPFTHPEGIESVVYNRAKDELLLVTKKNKLLLLDSTLQVKTGLQLTANDRYGISQDGNVLYYARDQYLSVFRNKLGYLDVFNAQKMWELLAKPKSPIKRVMDMKRRRTLGLKLKG